MTRGLPRTLARAATREAGLAPPRLGLKAITTGQGGSFRTVFTFAGMQVPVAKAQSYAGQLLFNFAKGKVRLKGGTARLQVAVASDRAATIKNNASLAWALGSAPASATTLAGTMANFAAATTRTLDGAGNALSSVSRADLAAAATLDGTATPISLYLNLAFATGTDIAADGTLAVTGTITLLWEHWGDNA